ncbi:hypothetical protein SNEBB_000910 [Seison nebaliae]|nr:hypothetical protein SNEBB_000910 [Seison nebaliae]
MSFLHTNSGKDARTQSKKRTALNPMIMAVIAFLIILGIIVGISVIVAAALDDDDSNASAAVSNDTREFSEGKMGVVQFEVDGEFDDLPNCNNQSTTVSAALGSELDQNINGTSNGTCKSKKRMVTLVIPMIFVIDLVNVKTSIFEAVRDKNKLSFENLINVAITNSGNPLLRILVSNSVNVIEIFQTDSATDSTLRDTMTDITGTSDKITVTSSTGSGTSSMSNNDDTSTVVASSSTESTILAETGISAEPSNSVGINISEESSITSSSDSMVSDTSTEMGSSTTSISESSIDSEITSTSVINKDQSSSTENWLTGSSASEANSNTEMVNRSSSISSSDLTSAASDISSSLNVVNPS